MALQGLGSSVDWSKKTPRVSNADPNYGETHTEVDGSGYVMGWTFAGDGQFRFIIDGETLLEMPADESKSGPTNFRFEDGFVIEAAPQGGWSGPVYYVLDG